MNQSITLHVHESSHLDPNIFSVDWRESRPIVYAEFTVASLKLLEVLDSEFVLANIPPRHRVLFAAIGRDRHDRLITFLKAGDEQFETRSLRPSGTFSGKERREQILFASTHREDIIRQVFSSYSLEWGGTYKFPFLVAIEEPSGWKDQLERLTDPRNPRGISADILRKCHCLIITQWDHGMVLVSDKVSKREVERITERIASKHELSFSVEEIENLLTYRASLGRPT